MLRIKFAFLFLCCLSTTTAFAEEDDALPEASAAATEEVVSTTEPLPTMAVVVRHPKYSYAKRIQFTIGPYGLKGDRYLSTYGMGFESAYHFSEKIGASVGFVYFRSSPSKNAGTLTAKVLAPVAHDPALLALGNFVYSPVYGKFALGSHIQRFRWQLSAGLHMAQETTSDRVQTRIQASKMVPGFQLGTAVSLPFTDNLFAAIQAQALYHGKLLEAESGGRRDFIYALQAGYLL